MLRAEGTSLRHGVSDAGFIWLKARDKRREARYVYIPLR